MSKNNLYAHELCIFSNVHCKTTAWNNQIQVVCKTLAYYCQSEVLILFLNLNAIPTNLVLGKFEINGVVLIMK